MSNDSVAARYGSGRTVRRIEDPALVRGLGRFTDDFAAPGQLHLAFVRSTYAHARLVSVDTDAARAVPGVVAVYTGADLAAAGVKPIAPAPAFPRPDGHMMDGPPRPPLAVGVVRFVGEAIAMVVADSPAAAAAGAEAVFADCEELPAIVGVHAAVEPGAPQVWPAAPGNVMAEMRHGDAAATEAAFAAAARRIVLDLDNPRVAPATMEPRSVSAAWDAATKRLTVRLASQMPTGLRDSLVEAIPGLSKESVRVVVGDVGGGFGMKTGAYPEDIAVAWAARQLGRPVKWQATRMEDLASALHGRAVASRAELALDADGRVRALRVHSLADMGAYPSTVGVAIQVLIGPWVSTSVYDIPLVDLRFTAVMTHTAPTGPYRGAGRPEAIYLIERLMDAAARELQMDPAALRRRNLIAPDRMPYTNAMGQTYDSGHFEKILDQGLALGDWAGYARRQAESKARGRLRGRAVSTFLEWTGGNAFEEHVSVAVTPDGIIELFTATQAMGQGIATSYAQLAVDVFGVPIERIRILQGDTDRGNGFGSAGSRSLFTGGTAVRVAAERTVQEGRERAAEALEAPAADIEYREGRFVVAGTDLGIDWGALAARQPAQRLAVESTAAAGGPTWPNGCHVCEVEVDPATGAVEIAAYASVSDIGRVISPAIVRGQVEGGAVQGIGQALCERVVYDPDSGQLLSGSLMDYALPRADGFIGFRTEFDTSIPCRTNPLGVKGVGELGTIGATPTVVNAVVDALAQAGLGRAAERVQMPLRGEVVWGALQGRAQGA